MKEYKIKDYSEQLMQLCATCKRSKRCKDHTIICAYKQFAFTLAKMKLKRREKVGVIE